MGASNSIFLIVFGVCMLIWLGATIFALRKHKMAAIAIFFLVPSVLMFVLILVYLVLLSTGYNPMKEDKAGQRRMTILNSTQ